MAKLMHHWLCLSVLFCSELYAVSLPTHGVRQVHSALPRVSVVQIDGDINVRLRTNQRATRVVASGDSRDLAQLKITAKHGELLLRFGREKYYFGRRVQQIKPIWVDISVGHLHRLVYRGKGQLTGKNIYTRGLVLWLKNPLKTQLSGHIGLQSLTVIGPGKTELTGVSGQQVTIKLLNSPKVQLNGVIAIKSLDLSGQGMFSAYWLNSPQLTVRARDSARIQLAGVAKQLDLELWGHSRFYGRYLRAAGSFVKTHDDSLAELATTVDQHTLAQDNSDVYFYNEPVTHNDFMVESGTVLDFS